MRVTARSVGDLVLCKSNLSSCRSVDRKSNRGSKALPLLMTSLRSPLGGAVCGFSLLVLNCCDQTTGPGDGSHGTGALGATGNPSAAGGVTTAGPASATSAGGTTSTGETTIGVATATGTANTSGLASNTAGGATGTRGVSLDTSSVTDGVSDTTGAISSSSGAGGAGTTGAATTGGDSTDDAIRVPQMTSCDGETSGLSASTIYYVTPNGSGDGSSFASAMSLQAALTAVQAGEMVLLQPGTYTIQVIDASTRNTIVLSKSGSEGAPIYLVAANCGRALFDFSYPADEWQSGDGKGFGFQLTGNYWYLKNLDVTNAGYHGIYIGGETADQGAA